MCAETALKIRTTTASGVEQLRLDIYKNLHLRQATKC